MKALVYEKAGQGSICEVPDPICGQNDVIIKVMASGICKWAEYGHHTTGTGLAKYPVIPGHEFAGYVREVGKNVQNVKVGDRVAADNTVLCGSCYACQRNQPLYCENFGSLGHNVNGGFAQYVAVDCSKVFIIPDHISFDEASITEPVACAVHAMDMLGVKFGENVIVIGMGPHGLILAQLAHHSGAQKAAAISGSQKKIALLEEYGIPVIRTDNKDYSIHEEGIAKMFPHGVDAVIDTSGSWPMVKSVFKFLRKGGRFLQYGSYHDKAALDITTDMLNALHYKEQKYISCSAQTHCYPKSLDYMASGKVKLDRLVSHIYPLEDYFKALETNMNDRSAIKVVIHPNGDEK